MHCTPAFSLVNMKLLRWLFVRTLRKYGLDYVKVQEKMEEKVIFEACILDKLY